MQQNLMITGSTEEVQKSSTFGDVRVGVATQKKITAVDMFEMTSTVRRELEALFSGAIPGSVPNDGSDRYIKWKTYKQLGGKDLLETKCINMFAGLPDSMQITDPQSTRILYKANMPTLVEYHRKTSPKNQLKYMTLKNKKSVLSVWQQRLLDKQQRELNDKQLDELSTVLDKEMHIVVDTRPKSQKKKARRMYRQVYLEGGWRDPFTTSSSSESAESNDQVHNAMIRNAKKFPLPVMGHIYDYIHGYKPTDEFLDEIVQIKTNMNWKRNYKRHVRRVKAQFRASVRRLHMFCINHVRKIVKWYCITDMLVELYTKRIDDIKSNKYNFDKAFLMRYCPENEVLYDIPTYYFDHMSSVLGQIHPQSREEYSMPLRMVLEALDIARDPEHYDYTKVIDFAENLITTMVLMNHSKNWQLAMLQFKQWLTMTFGFQICSSIYNWLENLFEEKDISVQSAGFDTFKRIFSDWKSMYQGEFIANIKKAIACVVALGFCTMNNLPFTTENFANEYAKGGYANRSYPSLITCIIDTIIYVFEKAHTWFKGGCEFLDIFRSDSGSFNYDVEMAFLRANISLYEENKLFSLNIEKYQFEERVHAAFDLTEAFYAKTTGSERRIMQINLNDLARIQTKMLMANKAMTIREAPFSYYLYGKTSVGKTAVSDIINNVLLRANGLDADPKFQVSLNPSDKYQSELENWIILIKLDDIANEKAEYAESNSCQLIVDYVNNNPRHALKADVDSKGKVLIQPKILMATTNVKDVEAHVKSNEPLSILRRLNKCITMVVKPAYRKKGSHMLDPSKMLEPICDAWTFHVQEPIAIETNILGATPFVWTTCEHEGKEMKDISMGELLTYLVACSKQHFCEQRRLIEHVEMVQKTDLCPHETYVQFCNICTLDVSVQSKFADESYIFAMKELKRVHRFYYYVMEFIPYHLLESDGFWYWSRTVMGSTITYFIVMYYQAICLFMLILYIFFGSFFTAYFVQVFFTYVMTTLITKCMCNIDKIHQNCKKAAQHTMKSIEPIAKHKYYVLAGFGTVASVLLLARRWRRVAPLVEHIISTQGSEHRTPKPDDVQRDNVWVKPYVEPVPRTIEVSTTTVDQLSEIIGGALAHANFRHDCGVKKLDSCIFPIRGNVWIAPYHVLRNNFDSIEIIRRPGDINSNRMCRINRHSWIRIANSDLALVTLPSAGDVRDLTSYIPESNSFQCEPVLFIHKDDTASVSYDKFVAMARDVEFTDSVDGAQYSYDGWTYELSNPSQPGLCMSPLICRGKFPWILGFHSAGVNGDKYGYGHKITRCVINEYYGKLFDRAVGDVCNINVQCHSTGDMILDFPEFNIKHLGELHYKSPFMFMEKGGCALLYGAHTGKRRHFRSNVDDSVIAESVCKHFGIQMMYGKPKNIGNYIPWHMDATKLLSPIDLNIDVLGRAYGDFETHIFDFLAKHTEYKDILCPMSRVATLSGVDGCRGIDAIKLATSAGFPRCKPKSNYVFLSDEEYENITRPLDVSPEIWLEIDRLETVLARGERVYFIHRINLKDEPTKLGKEKVRTFAGCTLECLIMIRMYFLPIAKMMMDHPGVFECAIGVNAHGPEWTELTQRMMKHGEIRTIAGDYTDYDTRMWCFLVLLAFNIFISIAEWAGYSERQLTIMRGIATELAYGLAEYNGEYAMFLIQNLSGHGLTVFINNLVNSLYMRYAYYDIWAAVVTNDKTWLTQLKGHLVLEDEDFAAWCEVYLSNVPDGIPKPFAEQVSLVCYGDDNKMSVSREINYFNHCTIAFSLGKCGIGYTMADKTSESVPFIHASQCSFLKRESVWSDEFQQYLAPLDIKSLYKTLQSSLVSKVLTRKQQAVEAIDCVLRELFYHGEVVFNEWHEKLNVVVDECDLRSYFKSNSLHTYDFLKQEYVSKYLCDSDKKNNHASKPIDEVAKTGLLVLDTQARSTTSYPECVKALLIEGNDAYLGMCSPAQRIRPHHDDNHNHGVVIQRVAMNTTINKVNSVSTLMGPEDHQNIVFRDGTPQWESSIAGGYEDTRKVGMDNTVPLDQFFSRPVKIDMPTWIPGSASPYSLTIDPWSTFFENKRVSNRISNFKLLQATLKIKFIINGNMFYYGRLMADYAPLAAVRDVDNFSTTVPVNRISASQRTHLYLNPTTSQGGEIHMPFIWPKNALDITLAEWQLMGNLYLREINPLKHANGSTSPVSITAYVWAEDVRLSVPTTLNAGNISAQSRDEYGTGPVSNLASNIAKITGKLESVPMIGPYAKATTIAATSMGSVAKIFGFSRPPIIDEPVKMRPTLISQMATTDVPDGSLKLTVDSKQELTIDPQVVGLDTGDELQLKVLAGKETYLTTFPWLVASTVDTLLWNTRVGPNHSVVHPSYAIDTAYQMPACQFVALPFQFWRGTMRYRFQIAASDFHRGRIKIVYDPCRIIGTETNIGFSRIVDLTTERDFTIDVSWGQTQTYLQCVTSLAASAGNFGTTLITTTSTNYNGVLGVYVVNDLTTPNSTVNNDIQVNVSISLCDDCEFQAPVGRTDRLSYTPQSGESEDTAVLDTDNAPVQTSNDDSIMECEIVDHTNDVYFGESIVSFRTLLKRYGYVRSWLNTTTGPSNWVLSLSDYPLNRAILSNGIDSITPGPVAANIVKTPLLTYLAPAFLAMRGGFRHKYMYNTDNVNDLAYTSVERDLVGTSQSSSGVGSSIFFPYVVGSVGAFANGQQAGTLDLQRGGNYTYTRAQPVLEVELPNYNNNRFSVPKNFNLNTSATFYPRMNTHTLYTKVNATTRSYFDDYVSVGEDFNLFLFQGAPPVCQRNYTPV
jgi:hypothetical protein